MFQNFKTLLLLKIPENRKSGILSEKWINSKFNVDRDIDYYLFSLYTFLLWIGLIFMSLMIADLWFKSGLILNAQAFETEKYKFIITYSMVMGPASFLIAVSFYIRLRLSISLHDTFIILTLADKHLDIAMNRGKSSLLIRRIFMLLASMIIIFLSHILPLVLINYFQFPKADFIIFSFNILPLFTIPFGALLLVYNCLLIEKIIRFFPQIKQEYQLLQHNDQRRYL